METITLNNRLAYVRMNIQDGERLVKFLNLRQNHERNRNKDNGETPLRYLKTITIILGNNTRGMFSPNGGCGIEVFNERGNKRVQDLENILIEWEILEEKERIIGMMKKSSIQ